VRDQLYPLIEPYKTGYLKLDDLHQMYWEESGNPEGVPVVVIHGGPGAGTSPSMRRFFDPAYYRILLYDQRGAGKSLPHGELRDNTTPHLIADLEKLRLHLGIESWYVFGGSWGTTLGIAYAKYEENAFFPLAKQLKLLDLSYGEDNTSQQLPRWQFEGSLAFQE